MVHSPNDPPDRHDARTNPMQAYYRDAIEFPDADAVEAERERLQALHRQGAWTRA